MSACVVVLLSVVAWTTGCATSAGAPPSRKLERDPNQLRAQFNADVNTVRVLLVLSPS